MPPKNVFETKEKKVPKTTYLLGDTYPAKEKKRNEKEKKKKERHDRRK